MTTAGVQDDRIPVRREAGVRSRPVQEPEPMQVYVLTFDSRASLSHAFDLVLAASDVDSCMIEVDHSRIRFTAPEAHASKLVEQIYQARGLRWCSRHALVEGGAGEDQDSAARY